MARYRRKPSEVDAEQFTDAKRPPRGVLLTTTFDPPHHYVVTAQDRHVRVDVGEWVVAEPSAGGCYYPVTDGEFRRLYDDATACAVLSPQRFYLICERRDDGGLRVTCPEVPGLALSHAEPEAVMRDVIPAINALVRHNGQS